VELFAEIRREYQLGVRTIKGVARKLGLHRGQVRQALADARPPERTYTPRARPVLSPVQAFVDQILEADRSAPRRQRHTARRIHDRVHETYPKCPIAASTVREYVREWKRQQGLLAGGPAQRLIVTGRSNCRWTRHPTRTPGLVTGGSAASTPVSRSSSSRASCVKSAAQCDGTTSRLGGQACVCRLPKTNSQAVRSAG
jgi:hypothetical protein